MKNTKYNSLNSWKIIKCKINDYECKLVGLKYIFRLVGLGSRINGIKFLS